MTDQNPAQQAPDVALAQAINGLIGFLQHQLSAAATAASCCTCAATCHTIAHLYDSDQLFDLSTHADSSTFDKACEALDVNKVGWHGRSLSGIRNVCAT